MITTQVQDLARGRAASLVPVELDLFVLGQGWMEVGHGVTNAEGAILDFGAGRSPGLYRLMFDVASYMPDSIFPSVVVVFEVGNGEEGYHLPLSLSPFGYSVHCETTI